MEQTRHVVFIGETGTGKSSVINLIADHNYTVVSPDAAPCTGNFASYDVTIEGRTYRLWDTPGLNRPSGFSFFRRSNTAAGSLKRFLRERRRSGELDLLVLCVRAGRATEGMSRVYQNFCRATRQIAIPVVIAITHLEKMQPAMDTWWDDNEKVMRGLGLTFDGYACLTCLSNHRRWASRRDVRDLISKEYPQRAFSTLPDQEYLNIPGDNGCVVC